MQNVTKNKLSYIFRLESEKSLFVGGLSKSVSQHFENVNKMSKIYNY